MIKTIIDTIMDFLYDLASTILIILPESPFSEIDIQNDLQAFQNIMSMINYFVPIGTMLTILSIYLTCVIIWYGARWILRLVQYID